MAVKLSHLIITFLLLIVMLTTFLGYQTIISMFSTPIHRTEPEFMTHYENLMRDTNSVLSQIDQERSFLNSSVHQIPKQHYFSLIKTLEQLKTDFQTLQASLKFCDEDKIYLKSENEALLDQLDQHRESLTKLQLEMKAHVEDPHGEAASPGGDQSQGLGLQRTWLAIGIPTIPRPSHQDYLIQVLHALIDALPSHPSVPTVRIYVMHMAPGEHHPVFERARAMFTHPDYPKKAYFSFHKLEMASKDPLGDNMRDAGTANIPGYKVRKQTRDVASLMTQVLSEESPQYFMFLEDDMRLCNHGMLAIRYLLEKAETYHPDWLAVRASYGMNGIFIHGKDMEHFRTYLLEHQARRPPDHLVVEWFAGETPESASYKQKRMNIGFRYNIFNHEGKVSTLGHKGGGNFPSCYEELVEPTVFKVEAFSPRQCPHDDIWPCKPTSMDPDLKVTPRLDWAVLRES